MKANQFFIFGLLLITTFLATSAQAQEASVVDVRRNITLSDEDAVYKDFYINLGEGSSLRKNMVVNVRRKINIRDSGTKAVGDFDALVGQLKIIHIGNKVSVAREFKLIPRDEEPMLEQIGIMAGDKIDLTGSYIDNTKPVFKHKTTENSPIKKEDSAVVESDKKTADAATVIQEPAREPAQAPATITPKSQPVPIPQI